MKKAKGISRLLKKSVSYFDRLSTNGNSLTFLTSPPFALSSSKGERGVFQQPARTSRYSLSLFLRPFYFPVHSIPLDADHKPVLF